MSASAASRDNARPQVKRRALLRTYGTFLGFLLIVAAFAFLRPRAFLNPINLRNVLEQASILAIISFVMTILMATGKMDLSVGSLASLSGVVVATLLLKEMNLLLAIAASLVLGMLAGALNGALVSYLGLSDFIITLATMTAFRGLSLWLTDGATIFGLPPAFLTIGQGTVSSIPVPIFIMLGVMILCWLLLDQTTLGRRWYAIGGNEEAAFLSGINVRRLRLSAFVLSGTGAALAGVVLTSRLASAHPLAGEPFMLSSFAAVFLGMTMFKEGQANIPGTFFGVLFMGVLNNGLNILQVNPYIQIVLTGSIIILSVLASRLVRTQR